MKVQDSEFPWVGDPDGVHNSPENKLFVDRRDDIDVICGIEDPDRDYSFDEFAVVRLGGQYYLLQTSGCSCPTYAESWSVELGPTTLQQIRQYVVDGDYRGYTLPQDVKDSFLARLDAELG